MPEPVTTIPPADPPKHGNQRGDLPRIRIHGGPFLDAHVHQQIMTWNAAGASCGEIIDRLVWHAQRTDFDPVANCVTTLKKKSRTR